MGSEIKNLLLVTALSMGTACIALADETETRTMANQQRADQIGYLEAAAAAQRGDYVIAYCFWRPLADKGEAEAQYALGWMYHNGYGLVSDDRAAKAWWEKAVAQGHTDAMFALGTLYNEGSSTVARDYTAAMRLWVQAASAGHENARFALHELALRDLPELTPVMQALRTQYPQLLGIADLRKNHKPRRTKRPVATILAVEEVRSSSPLGLNIRSEEWIAVAAGYRPEFGWAAAHLVRESGELLATIQR